MSGLSVPKRFMGLELAGAKNSKTALAVLEFYPKEKKTFLLDLFREIPKKGSESGDEALLATLEDCYRPETVLGIHTPLTLPPCVTCTRKTCPLPEKCSVPAVKWMRQTLNKASKRRGAPRSTEITPYTQRPVEIWLRYEVLSQWEKRFRFDVDEALGGTKGPLTARMQFLQRHLSRYQTAETLPKFSLSLLAKEAGCPQRWIRHYRELDEGAYFRGEIVKKLSDYLDVFVYDRDLKTLQENLPCFHAFLSALTVWLDHQNHSQKPPKGFPLSSGWIALPSLSEPR